MVFSQVNERPVDIRLNERFWYVLLHSFIYLFILSFFPSFLLSIIYLLTFHHRDEPQIVTAISGIPSDNDR